VLEMGDETLKTLARELVKAVRASATIDWNLKDSAKAAMRSKVRRLLARYDYPPDREEHAVELVLQQAELFASDSGVRADYAFLGVGRMPRKSRKPSAVVIFSATVSTNFCV
jgi:hypothetical protein